MRSGWAPATTTAGIPLPDRLESTTESLFGFFGRQPEKERLIEAVKNAAEGTHSVVLLSGEPGIGKTSLCKEVARATNDLGVPVLYGRCDEDLVVSYQPFAEALAHLVVHAQDSLLGEHVATAAERSRPWCRHCPSDCPRCQGRRTPIPTPSVFGSSARS